MLRSFKVKVCYQCTCFALAAGADFSSWLLQAMHIRVNMKVVSEQRLEERTIWLAAILAELVVRSERFLRKDRENGQQTWQTRR